ncbi:MAG TPA: glycosyltransferase family 39 protein [Terriglobales bacterium]|nr:glycosyltransferase family 39 protein [Terriglobales bacterium]
MPEPAIAANTEPHTTSTLRFAWNRPLIPALLLSLYVIQCVWFIRTQSLTYDEPVHIAEGLDAWRNGRFEDYSDHPPLARLLCTLPLIGRKWQVDVEKLPSGFRVPNISPDPVSLASRARSVNVVLGVLLGLLLWLEAARLFSAAAANFTLALFALSPSLVAHFSSVTTDGAATLLIFATAVQIVRWKRMPSWRTALICGVVFGFLLLAKFSTVPIFFLAAFWMLVLANGQVRLHPLRWNWAKTVAALLIAFLIVWAGYFFHVSHLTIHDHTLVVTHPHWTAPLVKPTRSNLSLSLPVPAGEFLAGLREVALHNAHGQPAYFLGQASPTGGWKAYYPVTILLKWPILAVTISCTGLVLCMSTKKSIPGFWILVSFPALYFLLAVFAHFNIGERHVLPVYPFALLFAGAAWQRLAARPRGMAFLLVLLLLHAADILRYAPGYLSYFNIFVSPGSSYRLLADSNLDWGQGLLALRNHQREHPDEHISLAYFGSVDPAVYGIHAHALRENEHATGIIVVSATNLAGEYLKDPNAYKWLLGSPRTAILDHSLYVFRVGQ